MTNILDHFIEAIMMPIFGLMFAWVVSVFILFIYLNLTKRRDRIVELALSKNDEYYGAKWVGFFASAYIFPSIALAALSMYIRLDFFKQKNYQGLLLVSNIHIDENYKKLFNEFKLFMALSLVCAACTFSCVFVMLYTSF